MRYVRSATSKAWKIAGHFIPPSHLSESAKRAGVQPWLSLGESEYAALAKNKIYNSLLANAEVVVMNTLPSEFVTLESVTTQNSALKTQLSTLQSANADLEKERKSLSSKAYNLKKKNDELTQEIASLKAQLASQSTTTQENTE